MRNKLLLLLLTSSIGVSGESTALLLTGSDPDPGAVTITFDELSHGELINAQISGVTISAVNFSRPFDLAAAFDTTLTGTRDSDLESASGGATLWSGGNLQSTDLGRILIVQGNDVGCGDGVCDLPDDEGSRPAGELIFVFGVPVLSFGFDLVDVESTVAENGSITFVSGDDFVTIPFSDFLDNSDLGDNTANRIAPFGVWELGLASIARVVIEMGGSGGVDNVTFVPVPEPSTVLLLALGLGAVALPRRKRARSASDDRSIR